MKTEPFIAGAPPAWAQSLLGLLLAPDRRENVAGDLLEEYRETMVPARGRRRADLWYVKQVAGFLWRDSRSWGILFGLSLTIRSLFDTFVPVTNYYPRSVVTTWLAASIYLLAGFTAARRTDSIRAATLVGVATNLTGFVVNLALLGLLALLFPNAPWSNGGGLIEAFFLPLFPVLPVALMIAMIGGLAGTASRRMTRRLRTRH